MADLQVQPGSLPPRVAMGADVEALLQQQRLKVAAAQPITRWLSADRPVAFRLELDDGSVLKARQFPQARRAAIVERILALRLAGFPHPIARHGGALLLPWVEGDTLASFGAIPLDVAYQCGVNLGLLHQQDVSRWSDVVVRQVGHVRSRLKVDTTFMVESGDLEPDAACRAHALADEYVPGAASAGIIHNDFCPENIALDASGIPVCIDNATLTFGPHDFDLARTWYRWPMSAAESDAFFRGYETCRSRASFERHFVFWATCMLMATAANRLRAGIAERSKPLDALHAMLDALARGETVTPWRPAQPIATVRGTGFPEP